MTTNYSVVLRNVPGHIRKTGVANVVMCAYIDETSSDPLLSNHQGAGMTTTITGRLWMRLISYQVLDQYMEFRDETNRSLARKAGVSQATVGHLRSGARNSCRPATARKIAFALQVLPESLFVPEVTTDQPIANMPLARSGPGTAAQAAPGARRKQVAR